MNKPRFALGVDLGRDPDATVVVIMCTNCKMMGYPTKIIDETGPLGAKFELHMPPCKCHGRLVCEKCGEFASEISGYKDAGESMMCCVCREEEDAARIKKDFNFGFRVDMKEVEESETYNIMKDYVRKKALEQNREKE